MQDFCERFFEKIFKSFPDRQNFKIFRQRAYKHLQNTKKYVIINKLISITIKNGLMVKRLRRCPLTAESAVRFRMGLPKKIQHHLVWCCIFLYAPARKRRGNLLPSFVNLRKQILAVGSHRPHLYFPISYIWETATSAWGDTTSVRETTRQLVCRRSYLRKQILAEELRFTKVKSFRKGIQTETATSAWGYTTSLRGNDAATCLPSFVFASVNFAVVLRFTEVEKIRKGMQTETATSAWGYVLLRCVERRGNFIFI